MKQCAIHIVKTLNSGLVKIHIGTKRSQLEYALNQTWMSPPKQTPKHCGMIDGYGYTKLEYTYMSETTGGWSGDRLLSVLAVAGYDWHVH